MSKIKHTFSEIKVCAFLLFSLNTARINELSASSLNTARFKNKRRSRAVKKSGNDR